MSTKRHIECMAPQPIENTMLYDEEYNATTVLDSSSDSTSTEYCSVNESSRSLWESSSFSLIEQVCQLSGTSSPTTVLQTVLHSYVPCNTQWKRIKRVRLSQCAPNFHILNHRFIFAGEHVYSNHHRHESVEFAKNDSSCIGFVEGILDLSSPGYVFNSKMLLIPLLDSAQPDDDNRNVVLMYCHQRYKYSLSSTGFVHCVAVQTEALLRPTVIIIDPYWIKKRFGLLSKFTDVPDDVETEREIRFFSVINFSPYRHPQKNCT